PRRQRKALPSDWFAGCPRGRRHVGQETVIFAVRLFIINNWAGTKMKIRMPRIAIRPAADSRGEREDFFGKGRAWIGERNCLGACQDGSYWRRRAEEGSERLRFGTTVGPCGGRNGSPLDLVNRNHPGGQKAKHNADAARDAAIAVPPAPDASRTDAEP